VAEDYKLAVRELEGHYEWCAEELEEAVASRRRVLVEMK
jgi:hypothetical protein